MLIGNQNELDKINLNLTEIINSNNEKHLDMLIDKELSFDVHIKSRCKKAWQKLSVLARLSTTDKFSYKVTV